MLIRNIITGNKSFLKNVLSNSQSFNITSEQLRNCYPAFSLSAYRNNCSNSRLILVNSHFQNHKVQRSFLQMDVRSKSTEHVKSGVIKDENPTIDEVNQKNIHVTVLTTGEKLKKAVKEYGSTVIVFHVGISLISLGICYLLVSSGLDITKIIEAVGLDQWITKSEIAASAGTFAVAYAIHKIFAPVRITITLGSVPFIVNYLRKVGFLKK